MITRDGYRGPTGTTGFLSTGKEPQVSGARREQAYWLLGLKVEEEFMSEPATLGDIYHRVTGPMGLSLDETRHMVSTARRLGYLRGSR